MLLCDIIDIIESAAPLRWQEEWDNSGLQVGNRNAEIKSVLLTTDITESVVAEAISEECQLIMSHHPLLFHGLKQVCGQTPQARCVEQAIRHNIAIYSAHTSMDKYLHGVSGRMAQKVGITNYEILSPEADGYGLGVVGELPHSIEPDEFLQQLKETFGALWLRYTQPIGNKIRKVAFCGGAGADLAEAAIQKGADAFVSADFKYHEFQELNGQIMVVDMDHWVSEHFTREIFAEMLAGKVNLLTAKSDESIIQLKI
ncbi:MAG: Nif3-like dinuclear metal center hexameric protein [Paludibacteraceae bacterium]|nr:Nif3-like dinuclear metal center hexameric protein [Paludibacteraceae bacterium]